MKIDNKKLDDILIRRCWDDSTLAAKMGITSTALFYNRYKVKRLRKSVIGRMAKALDVEYTEIVESERDNMVGVAT